MERNVGHCADVGRNEWSRERGEAVLLDDPNVDSSLVNEEGCTARMLAARGVEKLFRKTATLVPRELQKRKAEKSL